jgi:hypothetical protein
VIVADGGPCLLIQLNTFLRSKAQDANVSCATVSQEERERGLVYGSVLSVSTAGSHAGSRKQARAKVVGLTGCCVRHPRWLSTTSNSIPLQKCKMRMGVREKDRNRQLRCFRSDS